MQNLIVISISSSWRILIIALIECETQSKFVLFKPKNLDEGISKCSMDIHFHSAVAFNDIYPIAESFNEEGKHLSYPLK